VFPLFRYFSQFCFARAAIESLPLKRDSPNSPGRCCAGALRERGFIPPPSVTIARRNAAQIAS
jgi:hypothetical protein